MMEFEYFRPRADIRRLIGSYYRTFVPDELSDVMRAEIANVRFMLRGAVYSDIGGTEIAYPAGSAIVCGPTFQWSHVRFDPGTLVVGAAIPPLGWTRLFGVPAIDLADQVSALRDWVPDSSQPLIDTIFETGDPAACVPHIDTLFAAIDRPDMRVNEAFLQKVTDWIIDPEPNELDDLLAAVDLSPRQIERLTRVYFGSAPKRLHRKFRALHSANRLTWQKLTDWRDVATTAYFDQSHFIREFRQFNGRTPREFIEGAHLLVRQTLLARRQIEHHSPFSLVG